MTHPSVADHRCGHNYEPQNCPWDTCEFKRVIAERDALKAKLADSEAALHRFQHGQQIEGDYICEAVEKERAARLKAEAACAAMREALALHGRIDDLSKEIAKDDADLNAGFDSSYEDEDKAAMVAELYAIHKRCLAALATDAGQNVIDFIAAARRLNDGVKLFIKIKDAKRSSMDPPTGFNADDLPSFRPLVADVDAADAKLGGKP